MMPYKRPAADKSGVPVYQPNATTYQQLMQLQQPFVPVSCEYSVSPSPAPATSDASSVATDTQQVSSASQVSQVKDDDIIPPASTSVTLQPPPTIHDPATLAKEVAQQNYAKAVKLATANQNMSTNPLAHLNALNYTGVALNKQTVPIPTAAAALQRYPGLPLTLGAANQFNLGINPYTASAIAHTNLINMSRQPSAVFNPYSLMRSPYPATTSHQILTPNYLAQFPVSVSTASITNVPPPTHMAAAAAQNNNNTVLQPYKKLKTS